MTNYMKIVRMLYKRLNFNSTAVGRFKMKASLKHTLRLLDEHNSQDKEDGQQWDDQLTDNNLFLIGDDLKTFAQFSEVERDAFLDSCFAPTAPKNNKKLQKQRSAYKKKLENAIEVETNPIAKQILLDIKEVPAKSVIENHLIQQLHDEDLVMARKGQRLTMVQKYADAHNGLIDSVNKKSTYIQEGLFKFPKPKDETTDELTDELSAEDYIFHMKSFLSDHFPDYEIKGIFCHLDEITIHSHYYLSGINQKTQDMDLHKRELEVVNNYIREVTKESNLDVELIPCDKKLSFKERQRFGRYFQRLFFEYTNNNLLLERGVQAVITDESERKSDLSKQRNEDNKLPKSERSYNYNTYKAEVAEQKANDADARLTKIEAKIVTRVQDVELLDEQVKTKKVERHELSQEIEELTFIEDEKLISLDEIETEISNKSSLLESINAQITETKSYLVDINHDFEMMIGKITNNIYVRAHALLKGATREAEKYAGSILVEYEKIVPKSLRDTVKAAAKSFNDEELESRMIEKDRGMDLDK